MAIGATLRSSDNRLAETWGHALRSILSLGLMNTAADNQSTYCISAFGLSRAVHHNLAILAEAVCTDACGDRDTLISQIGLGVNMTMTTRN